MKVLLLHPEDAFDKQYSQPHWDLVVDLGRAPRETYADWCRKSACAVGSIYDHAEETEDLYRLRTLLQLGTGRVVDQWGIDWWDIFSLEIASGIQRLMLVQRLSKNLPANCDLYSSRPHPAASALEQMLGVRVTNLSGGLQFARRRIRRYSETLSGLGSADFLQILEDKFDADHSVRRRFTAPRSSARKPAVLLPSAYVNVSRTALAYAALLPQQQFMLVVARRNGYVAPVPPNVLVASLAPYFGATDKQELAALRDSWDSLRISLAKCAAEFKTAESEGRLGAASAPFGWGLAVRDAWLRFLASERVTACLSADDSNPNTRIPLILAQKQGIPALGCHHGALDFRMAIKTNHADLYLAKSEMERDYLRRICHLAPEKIAVAGPASLKSVSSGRMDCRSAPWLVFFTEPYQSFGWRSDEVYHDLLPRLCSLAQTCGLKLVFNLHPFENIKTHRRMLRRLLPEQECNIEVLAGPPSDRLWSNTRFALTVQSSTALECAALGIPVFLCAWLRDPYCGYVRQYARYGVGYVLESSEQIAEIPGLLADQHEKLLPPPTSRRAIDSDKLAHLLSGAYSLPVVSNA
jgi:hypothetical protein